MLKPNSFQYLTGLHHLWLDVSSCSSRQDFQNTLSLADSGICDNARFYVENYNPDTVNEDFQPRWQKWPEFSGHHTYPVPHEVRDPCDAYHSSSISQMWGDTPYGRSRKELLEFLIDSFAQDVWEEFGNIPIDENDCLEEAFYDWDIGTDRFTVWQFFDEILPMGLGDWLGD